MKMKTLTLKAHNLCITGIPSGALLLTLVLGCSPAKDASAQPEKPSSAPPTSPGGVARYDSQPGGGKVKIEGTSNIHPHWDMESPVIGGFIETDTGFPESALKGGAAAKPKVEVFIPVRSLKSDNKKMDEIYQEHMEEAKFKKMEYKLTELKPKGDAPKAGKCEFDAVGTLTIHGVSKPLTMPVTFEKAEVEKDGKKSPQLKITGTTPLKMSDFGVKPPNPKLPGLPEITTGDEIKVTFEWSPRQK
jgi:polyisoprenoid-binding protein YceI